MYCSVHLTRSAFEITCFAYIYRFQKKYILLGAIWYSSDKPYMYTYLKPIMEEINELYSQGENKDF